MIIFAENSKEMNETKKVSRRKYTAEFKAKVALEAMQENQTLPELCSKYQLSPNQVNQWKKRLRERSAEAFRADASGRGDKDRLIEQLYKTIGELTMDVEFLKKSCFHECRAALRDGLQGGEAEHTPSVRASRPVPRHVLLHPGE